MLFLTNLVKCEPNCLILNKNVNCYALILRFIEYDFTFIHYILHILMGTWMIRRLDAEVSQIDLS